MYYTKLDIINIYKKVKCQKPVNKIPKLKPEILLIIQDLVNAFNTKWSNISPLIYFECGQSIYKTFTYKHFLNEKILQKYINKDKIIKRKDVNKTQIIKSIKYIKSQKYNSLKDYATSGDNIKTCIIDYFYNKIDKVIMSLLIFDNYFNINEIDKLYTSYIWNNEITMKSLVKRYKRYIKKLEKEYLNNE